MSRQSRGANLDDVELNGINPGSSSEASAEAPGSAYDRSRFPDDFYVGLITYLDPMRGRGIIRSHSGREIRFQFPFVTVVGAELAGRMPGIDLMHEGDSVGFDVGWTSKGLRVTTIKPTRHDSK